VELNKQYIIQCIITASNQLRLSSEKIEVVALLKEHLSKCTNIGEDIQKMKKITELSKFGIKLGEIFSFIDSGKIDFSKISDKFKEHSHFLVKELSFLLDIVTPSVMKKILNQFSEIKGNSPDIDLTQREKKPEIVIEVKKELKEENNLPKRSKADELKEALIFEELNKELGLSFENYEDKILKPIKSLDTFLEKVVRFDFKEYEINSYITQMKENAELSDKLGFEIISNMHNIFYKGLELVRDKKMTPSINLIESLRACLIVIVAIVRGKEVDINNYLNIAETFGYKVNSFKKGT